MSAVPIEYPLGRLESPDERDKNYQMRSLLPTEMPKIKRKRWTPGPVLDQMRTSSCVGHAWKQFLQTTPVPTMTGPSALDIYRWAVDHDEWPFNDGKDMGTSVRAGVRALENLGRIKQYLWAWDVDTTARWLLTRGPVVVGSMWTEGMFVLDPLGYVVPNGRRVGGHAYLVYGVDTTIRTFYAVNSWGALWGSGGLFKVRYEHMNILFNNDAEVCTAMERRL